MRLFRKTSKTQGRMPADSAGAWAFSAHHASRSQVSGILHGGRIQTKLSVSQPGDVHELEADKVADSVMRMPEARSEEECSRSAPEIQRACADCEEEKDETLSRKAQGEAQDGGAAAAAAVEGRGDPLPSSARAFFEPRFGKDFGEVRVHHDSKAAEANRELNSEAFAYRNHIAFATGRYSPESQEGRRLLAHELTHVVQQGYGSDAPETDEAKVMPYRSSKSVNFQGNDGGGLTEKEFNSKTPDPYVEKITVAFNSTTPIDGETVPSGTLSATYAANGASSIPANISGVAIVGGFPSSGLTDKGKNMKVHRVEGWGYHHLGVPKADRVGSKWPQNKYFQKAKGGSASMSYALFFHGKEAIHLGMLNSGSLACVHVGSEATMRQINYHTREDITKVDVTYTEAALKMPCCERYDAVSWMPNPCGGRDPKKCP